MIIELDANLLPYDSKVCVKVVFVPNDVDETDQTTGGGTGGGGDVLTACSAQSLQLTQTLINANNFARQFELTFIVAGVVEADVLSVHITPTICAGGAIISNELTGSTTLYCTQSNSTNLYQFSVVTTNCEANGVVSLNAGFGIGQVDSETINFG